jgi:hypothetical protein
MPNICGVVPAGVITAEVTPMRSFSRYFEEYEF